MADTYMSVGEVAELVGVTVRSIQYYDQQGILSPSAKGPQNQRLYTPADVDRLYCVLCLKYAGLSLSQVRACLQDGRTVSSAQAFEIFSKALRETTDAFTALLDRYAALHALAKAVEPDVRASSGDSVLAQACEEEPDWRTLMGFVERAGTEGGRFWRLSCVFEDAPDAASADAGLVGSEGADGNRTATEWHGVISETINHMNSGEPLDSERGQAIVRRCLALCAADGRHPDGRSFLLLESAPADHPGGSSFDGMRRRVHEHLHRMVARYAELHPDEDVSAFFGGGAR